MRFEVVRKGESKGVSTVRGRGVAFFWFLGEKVEALDG